MWPVLGLKSFHVDLRAKTFSIRTAVWPKKTPKTWLLEILDARTTLNLSQEEVKMERERDMLRKEKEIMPWQQVIMLSAAKISGTRVP